MIIDLEKQFFDTFGIKPSTRYKCIAPQPCAHTESPCKECTYGLPDSIYPQITDPILLELICIANVHESFSATTNIKNIQARTLRMLLRADRFYKNYYGYDREHKKLVKQVRTLFGDIK